MVAEETTRPGLGCRLLWRGLARLKFHRRAAGLARHQGVALRTPLGARAACQVRPRAGELTGKPRWFHLRSQERRCPRITHKATAETDMLEWEDEPKNGATDDEQDAQDGTQALEAADS